MQRAHASRGRRGGSRDRPRQLRLARRLVRAVRALQPSSGSRGASMLAETVAHISSGGGGRQLADKISAQPRSHAGCAELSFASTPGANANASANANTTGANAKDIILNRHQALLPE